MTLLPSGAPWNLPDAPFSFMLYFLEGRTKKYLPIGRYFFVCWGAGNRTPHLAGSRERMKLICHTRWRETSNRACCISPLMLPPIGVSRTLVDFFFASCLQNNLFCILVKGSFFAAEFWVDSDPVGDSLILRTWDFLSGNFMTDCKQRFRI